MINTGLQDGVLVVQHTVAAHLRAALNQEPQLGIFYCKQFKFIYFIDLWRKSTDFSQGQLQALLALAKSRCS